MKGGKSSCLKASTVLRTKKVNFCEFASLDLKKLLISHPDGIKEDEDLKVCYKGLEEDLQELKNEGWVRIIKSNKDFVLFPLNKEEQNVEIRDQISTKTKNLLTDIWDKDVIILFLFQFFIFRLNKQRS